MKPILRRLLIIGSSGHASVVLDAIETSNEFAIEGQLDDTIPPGSIRNRYPVLGRIDDIVRICDERAITDVVIAIGDNWWRRKTHSNFVGAIPRLRFPTVKHPAAVIASSARIGQGAVLLSGSHVGPDCKLGDFCILNTNASLDHDCVMQNFASLAPGATSGGLVRIGECTAVGVGVAISDRISIGSHTVIGTGAAVVRDIPDFAVAYGNPARIARSRPEGEPYVDTQQRVVKRAPSPTT